MSNPVGRPRKLAAIMGSGVPDVLASMVKHEISTDEAEVLLKLSMSGADVNDMARKALTYFLESLTLKSAIDDKEARTCMDVLKQSSTSKQRELSNAVLNKYISKFYFAQPKADKTESTKSAKEEPVVA